MIRTERAVSWGVWDQIWCGMGPVTPRGSNVIILATLASQMSWTSMLVVLELSSLGHSCQIVQIWESVGFHSDILIVHPNVEVVTFSGLWVPEAAMADLGVPTRPTWTQF